MNSLDHGISGSSKPSAEEMADRVLAGWDEPNPKQTLPSRFQLGDSVRLNFFDCGGVNNCEVIKVHFAPGKVLYDVGISIGGATNYTRVYNVDSTFVSESLSDPRIN